MKVIINALHERCIECNNSGCECDVLYNTGDCTDTCYPDFANVTRNDNDDK